MNISWSPATVKPFAVATFLCQHKDRNRNAGKLALKLLLSKGERFIILLVW